MPLKKTENDAFVYMKSFLFKLMHRQTKIPIYYSNFNVNLYKIECVTTVPVIFEQ